MDASLEDDYPSHSVTVFRHSDYCTRTVISITNARIFAGPTRFFILRSELSSDHTQTFCQQDSSDKFTGRRGRTPNRKIHSFPKISHQFNLLCSSSRNAMPLDVIIVGAGIAGLCAAVALRQAGHSVTIFEKSRFAAEVGAAILLTSNGTRVLSRMGFSFERARGRRVTAWDNVDGTTLEPIVRLNLEDVEERYGAPLVSIHRVDLHNELLRLATVQDSRENEAPKVRLLLNSRVVEASADDGSVTLADGSVTKADLVVAADGVRSVLRDVVLGEEAPKPSPTGLSAFRFLIPTDSLKEDPQLIEILKWKCKGPTVLADTREGQRERHIVWYDCQGWAFIPFLSYSGHGC